MRAIATFLLALVLFATAGAAMANPDYDLGPAIGTAAPPIGTPLDSSGKTRPLESLMGNKGLVLIFFRSADWCPYCQAQLIDLNGGAAEIEKRGYKLAGISYDAPEVAAKFVEKRALTYPLLSDPKSEIIERYKLLDPQYPPGHRAHGVPQPIIFILDRSGVIKAKLYEDNYKKRPPQGLVLETLDKVLMGK